MHSMTYMLYREFPFLIKSTDRQPGAFVTSQNECQEVEEELYGSDAEFRTQKYRYFSKLGTPNQVAGGAAVVLVGSLFALLMFDEKGHRMFYLAIRASSRYRAPV